MLVNDLTRLASSLPRVLQSGAIVLVLSITACQSNKGAVGQPVSAVNVQTDVRAQAVADGAGLQVRPLQNPGQRNLLQQARAAEQAGEIQQAEALLLQALKIQPRDPEILQQLAEIKLQQQQYEQANAFAQRSYVVGPQVGEICSRNWLTIAAVRRYYRDDKGAYEATTYATDCSAKPPERF